MNILQKLHWQARKKAWPVFVVKEVLAKPKQKTKNNPRLLQT